MGIFGLNPHALQVRTQWLQAIRRIPRIRRDLPPRLAGAEAVRSSCREGGKMAGLIGWWSPVTLLNCFIYIYMYIYVYIYVYIYTHTYVAFSFLAVICSGKRHGNCNFISSVPNIYDRNIHDFVICWCPVCLPFKWVPNINFLYI